jgi:hypothetical protein
VANVVTIVSKGGGQLRVGLQVGLILLFKERVLRGGSRLDRSWRGCENVGKTTENRGCEEEGPYLGTHADNITTVDREDKPNGLSGEHGQARATWKRTPIHSARSSITGSTDSARCAGIQVASRPISDIAKTTPASTTGSRGVA